MNEKKEITNDLLLRPLVGKDIEILESTSKSQVGMKGKIVLETASFFHILENGQIRRILKKNIIFKVSHKGKALKMVGRLLSSTIRYRIKKNK